MVCMTYIMIKKIVFFFYKIYFICNKFEKKNVEKKIVNTCFNINFVIKYLQIHPTYLNFPGVKS